MTRPSIVVMAGSSRRDSFARRLAHACLEPLSQIGADVQLIELGDYPMPLYNGDLERDSGLPDAAVALQQRLYSSDGVLVVNPEYNGSITPLLKNAIDWASRREGDEGPLVAFRGRTALLLSTSPGVLGGLRGLVHVRAILSGIGVHVVPDQLAIGGAKTAFDDVGALADPDRRERLRSMLASFVDVTARLRAG